MAQEILTTVIWIILSDMKKYINTLLKSLGEKLITRHVICPSARALLIEMEIAIPNAHEIIDERSAGYVATGMCAETEEPIVVWCADNDSYRNLTSALTEAYYRKLPLLVAALSCNNKIDQTINPYDTIRYYVNNTLYKFKGTEEEVDRAINYLYADVKGPVYLSVTGFREPNVEKNSKENSCYDVTTITKILPSDTCVHIGKDFCCECCYISDNRFRSDHYTKDGNLSMLIGSSVVARKQLHVGIFSSDEISYDLNMLGNRHVDGNIVLFALLRGETCDVICEVANSFGWECRRVDMCEIDSIKEKLTISDKPQYIEIVL